MLEFFLVSLIVGSGLIIGFILSVIAKEELKPGKRYFLPLKTVLFFAVILITSFYYFNINFLISLFVLLLSSVFFIERLQIVLMYLSFSIIYIVSYTNDGLHIIISSLIFFAGFPIGTLAAYKEKKAFIKRILIPYILFIVIAFLRYLVWLL